MSCEWKLIDDLSGGTAAMRKAGEYWLPREDAESVDTYQKRLKRSFLYEMLADTRNRLTSKPFSKQVSLPEPLPERLAGMDRNVDKLGSDLTAFARKHFHETTGRGLVHTLVEYPDLSAPGETDEQRRDRITLEQDYKIHPFFTRITADQLLQWKSSPDPTKGAYLTMIRFVEWVNEPDPADEFSDRCVEQVRVIEQWSWRTYRVDAKGAWTLYKSGTSTLGEVPLRTWYTNRTGYMTGACPLRALAWINLAHWCASSDHNNCLRFSSFGHIFFSGVPEKDRAAMQVVGPARIHWGPKDSTMEIVEDSGAAIGSGRTNLLDLEARGEVFGLAPLMERTANTTATGRAIDDSKTTCDVQAWAIAGEIHFRECFELAAKWGGVELAEKFAVNIFSDFAINARAADDIRNLLQMRVARQITHTTFLKEVRRRALVSEDLDIEQEIEDLANEVGTDGFTGTNDEGSDPTKTPPGENGEPARVAA